MASPKILMVLTSHDRVGDTGTAGGYWFEELAAPWHVFREAGCEVALASIRGGAAPRDPLSETEDWMTDATRRFAADPETEAAARDTRAVAEVDAAEHDAVFLVGGIAAMWDFPGHAALTRLVEAMHRDGKTVVSVCHGPPGLVDPRGADGRPVVEGRRLTCWTDSEERLTKTDEVVPFLLETRLRELGARFEGGADLASVVREDGPLVTGQNPASSEATARAVVAALGARSQAA